MDPNHHTKKYIDFHDKYTKIYGENTIVLMQSGSHFNIFAVINDEINHGPDIYFICQNILNNALQVTKQNKNKPEISYSNCLLAGFPLMSIQKYENILLNNNYTVVIVEQITPPPNPERGVTRIVSPGTTIDGYNKQENHYLMSIYIEKNVYMTKDMYIAGISSIDLSTGKNYLHYIINKLDDDNFWNDEIGRYINFYNPSEIIFHFKNFELSKNDVIQNWDISHNSIQINHYNDKNYLKTTFQNELLQSIFDLSMLMTPLEHFDLEMKTELALSYIYLLLYIKDHRTDILNNIERPKLLNDNQCLSLTSNSIRQLNVINNYSYYKGKNESLLSVCNLCVTPMGRRLFKERLLYPSINPETITERYDYIECFKKDDLFNEIIPILRKVSDLEKSLRKMGINLLQPNDFYSDSLSFEYIRKVLDILENEKIILEKMNINETIQNFKNFYEYIHNTFIFNNFSTSGNLDRSFLKSGINDELDMYDALTVDYHSILLKISKRLSKLLDNSETSIKLDYDERNQWFFYCTNKRATTFKERLSNLNNNLIHVKDEDNKIIQSFGKDDFSFKKKDGSSTMIITNYSKEISSKLITIQDKINKLNKDQWKFQTDYMFNTFNVSLKNFYLFLAEVDVYSSNSKLSIQNGYYRPNIIESKKSFVNSKEIRHPIVEKIHTNTEYITNDIDLGMEDKKDGMLLFGTNACGKSTLMKAVGLNIIMAQAGLFVPSSSFEFYPYKQIFTRILNNDNIFRSQSSFAVEIQELKSILNRSDESSIVLGDELCSGTESISALSIITAGLNTLCERKSSFIFTSHLHELTKLEEVKSLNNLEIFHLKIDYDRVNDILIYDRKLEKGSGPSIYGLKVCEAMGLSTEFMNFANKIQNKLENNTTDIKLSQYNTNVFMNECKICLKKGESLETHHIKDQKYADSNNMISHHHKNIKHNLVPLCKACHLKVTNHELIVTGWKETSRGKILEWKKAEKKLSVNKKFTHNQVEYILELRSKNKCISQKDFLKKIEIENDIKLSPSTFKKMIDNKY